MKTNTRRQRTNERVNPRCYPLAFREAVIQSRRVAINTIRESDKILGFVTKIERIDAPKDTNE